MSGTGWGVLSDVREWSGGLFGCPGVVGRPSRMSGSGRDDLRKSENGWMVLSDVREWSGDPHKCPGRPPGYTGLVGRPYGF